ncbi:MAG: hypothetical protein HeimC2_33970 [Candidatus Heimdallarchaeota archaeon LC_2]|nr:MAG: hypothetical protein HeimC2_33970 [Candidatus Heimdallarchaeota archaeon LC_2]
MTDSETHIHANFRCFLNSETESNPLFSTATYTRVQMFISRPDLGNPTLTQNCTNCGQVLKLEVFSSKYQKTQRKIGKRIIIGFILYHFLFFTVALNDDSGDYRFLGEIFFFVWIFALWGINHYFRNPIKKKSSWANHNLEYPPRDMDDLNYELIKHG